MISIATLIQFVIVLLILAIVLALVFWVLNQIPGLPPQVMSLIRIAVVVIAVLIIVVLLLNIAGIAVIHAGTLALPSYG